MLATTQYIDSFDPVNRQYARDYARHLALKGIRESSSRNKMAKVYSFIQFIRVKIQNRVHGSDESS